MDLELNILMGIVDVTEQVQDAIDPKMSPEQAFKARRAVVGKMEQESLKKTGLRSDVVTLYQGNKFNLYRYKRYTDVRLVFAPEQQIAFYGGDATTSPTRATTWMSASSASTRTTSRRRSSII